MSKRKPDVAELEHDLRNAVNEQDKDYEKIDIFNDLEKIEGFIIGLDKIKCAPKEPEEDFQNSQETHAPSTPRYDPDQNTQFEIKEREINETSEELTKNLHDYTKKQLGKLDMLIQQIIPYVNLNLSSWRGLRMLLKNSGQEHLIDTIENVRGNQKLTDIYNDVYNKIRSLTPSALTLPNIEEGKSIIELLNSYNTYKITIENPNQTPTQTNPHPPLTIPKHRIFPIFTGDHFSTEGNIHSVPINANANPDANIDQIGLGSVGDQGYVTNIVIDPFLQKAVENEAAYIIATGKGHASMVIMAAHFNEERINDDIRFYSVGGFLTGDTPSIIDFPVPKMVANIAIATVGKDNLFSRSCISSPDHTIDPGKRSARTGDYVTTFDKACVLLNSDGLEELFSYVIQENMDTTSEAVKNFFRSLFGSFSEELIGAINPMTYFVNENREVTYTANSKKLYSLVVFNFLPIDYLGTNCAGTVMSVFEANGTPLESSYSNYKPIVLPFVDPDGLRDRVNNERNTNPLLGESILNICRLFIPLTEISGLSNEEIEEIALARSARTIAFLDRLAEVDENAKIAAQINPMPGGRRKHNINKTRKYKKSKTRKYKKSKTRKYKKSKTRKYKKSKTRTRTRTRTKRNRKRSKKQ